MHLIAHQSKLTEFLKSINISSALYAQNTAAQQKNLSHDSTIIARGSTMLLALEITRLQIVFTSFIDDFSTLLCTYLFWSSTYRGISTRSHSIGAPNMPVISSKSVNTGFF